MAYTLTPPSVNPQAPAWLKMVIAGMQATADHSYLDALSRYDSGAADWVAANVINRSASTDPAHFVPLPFATPIPARDIFDGNADGTYFAVSRTDMVSPPVHAPSLPTYVAPAPAGTIHTDSGTADSANNAALATIINLLLEIKAAVVK